MSLMNLGSLESPIGSRKRRKRVGRGDGSGHGKTSTRGHKGQKARAGGYHKRGFEGGQIPLTRRLPKYGFTNPTRVEYAVINVGDLNEIPAGTVVDSAYLTQNGYLSRLKDGVKVLGFGELKVSLTLKVTCVSESAKKKIEQAGGQLSLEG